MIPDGWERKKLGELTEEIRNGFSCKQDSNVTGIPVTRIETISEGVVNYEKIGYTDTPLKKIENYKLCYGDILFSHINSIKHIGKVAQYRAEKELFHGMNLMKISPKKGIVNKNYLFYYMQDNTTKRYFETRAKKAINQASLNKNDLVSYEVNLPPLPEQKKIASILSSVDEAIQATQKVIDQSELVKQGLLQELLTKGIGHTEFKMTEIGEIPVGWEVVKLGANVSLMGGFAFKSKDASIEGVKWLKIANVSHNKIKWDSVAYLPSEYINDYKDYRLFVGDIVIAMTRPLLNRKLKIAKLSENDTDSLLNQRVGKFTFNNNVDPNFFYNFVQSDQFIKDIEAKIYGTDPPNISSSMIESFLIPLPSISEQKQIATVLSSVDDSIQNAKGKKVKLENVKKGLMQDLLTGKVRVKV